MFSPKTDELVTELNKAEYDWAIASWGPTYSSHEEEIEVVSEEIEEAKSELFMFRAAYREWVRNGTYERASDMYHFVCNTIKELSQVAAVTAKIIYTDCPELSPLEGINGNN